MKKEISNKQFINYYQSSSRAIKALEKVIKSNNLLNENPDAFKEAKDLLKE